MTRQRRPVVAIVDSWTCSHFLFDAFTALGVDLVQVKPDPELAAFGPPMAYLATVTGADPAALADQLAGYSPVAVLAGQEPDVPLADSLSERLGLPSNGTALSSARRNKYDMAEALRAAGVRCAEQFKSDRAADVVAWAEGTGRWPVVVKPLASAATDNVAICSDAGQVRQAAETVLGSEMLWGEPNSEVLVQSYLDGVEYVVDSVSWDGRRYTCGVWEYRKRQVGVHNIYDYEVLVPAEDPRVPVLVDYVDSALRALGIGFGPTHAEVILTADGPALVEVGARLAGNLSPTFHDLCLGANQAALTALAYTRPAEFTERYAGRRYTALRQAWVCNTPTEQAGLVRGVHAEVIAEIEALPTVRELIVKLRPGWRMRPTVDLLSATLKVFLAAGSSEELRRDYQRIAELKDRVYQLD